MDGAPSPSFHRPRCPEEGRFRRLPCPAPPAASLRCSLPRRSVAGPGRAAPQGQPRAPPAGPAAPPALRTLVLRVRAAHGGGARSCPRLRPAAPAVLSPGWSPDGSGHGVVPGAPLPGGGGSSPGLPSPPGDATPPRDAQTALIKKLNTAAAATASSSTSSPAPFHRYSAALLSSPAFHGLNPGAWKLPAKHYVRCIGKGRAGAAAERGGSSPPCSAPLPPPRPGTGASKAGWSLQRWRTGLRYRRRGCIPPGPRHRREAQPRRRRRRAGPVEPRWARRGRCSPCTAGRVSHARLSAAC